MKQKLEAVLDSVVVTQSAEENSETSASSIRKKVPLLKRFEIPVEHLDFGYVEKCSDVQEIERILRILRSGEEGYYPDLLAFVECRLQVIQPNSRVLRVEIPVVKSETLPKEQQLEIQHELLNWLDTMDQEATGNARTREVRQNEIFGAAGDQLVSHEIPIRSQHLEMQEKIETKEDAFIKKVNPNRIKSWEYDKWDKLDVEAELTKLDVTHMQISEWEKYQKPKLQQEQKNVEKLMKNMDNNIDDKSTLEVHKNQKSMMCDVDKPCTSLKSVDKPSFIEEIPDSSCSGNTNYKNKKLESNPRSKAMSTNPKPTTTISPVVGQKPKRRIKIQIDDVHMGF